MCTYNGAVYLQEQLDSISAQTRLPDELVICDDCSSDGTAQIIEAYRAGSMRQKNLQSNKSRTLQCFIGHGLP